MKKIYLILLSFMTLCVIFTSCSAEDPFSTATSDDNPRILDPIFPDRSNGQLATFATISRTDTLNMKLTVTPLYAEMKQILTAEEVEKLSAEEINAIVRKAMEYDEYRW